MKVLLICVAGNTFTFSWTVSYIHGQDVCELCNSRIVLLFLNLFVCSVCVCVVGEVTFAQTSNGSAHLHKKNILFLSIVRVSMEGARWRGVGSLGGTGVRVPVRRGKMKRCGDPC